MRSPLILPVLVLWIQANDGKLDTGILAPNQTINLILRVTPNLASANTDQTKINGVSFMDNKIDPTKNTVRTITKTTTSPLAALSPQAGQVVINEVLFRQTGASAIENDEFIELYNPSNTAIELKMVLPIMMIITPSGLVTAIST
jgi:hypothetical protein